MAAAEQPGDRPLPGFLAAFGFRSYRLLWLGAFTSSVGTWTQDVALNWLVHERFVDPRYLGYRSFVADAPLIAFMLLGGAAADRVDRRRILLTSQVLQMCFAACLGVLYALDRLGIAPILLFAFLTGLAQSQSAPTYQAVLTTVVPPPQIQSAVALNSLQFNLSRAIGPVIAGILLARAGTGPCFAVNVVSFLAVIAALLVIEIPSPRLARKESLGQSLSAGFAHVRRSRVLSLLVAMSAAGSFLAFPLITYLPVIAGDVLKTGATGYSQLLTGFGVGAIVGALVTAQRGGRPGRGKAMLEAIAAYGLATLAAVFSPLPWLSATLLFVSGFSLVSAFSVMNSLAQEHAPLELRGRVVSIYGFAFRGGMPLGSLIAGFLVEAFGAPATIGGFSAALLVGAVALRLRGGGVLDF